MTNHNAVSASLYPYSVDDFLIEKACADSGLYAEDAYSSGDKSAVAKATVSILRNLIVLSGESNGGYTLSYDTDKLKERILSLARENGMDDIVEEFDNRSKIIDISDQW